MKRIQFPVFTKSKRVQFGTEMERPPIKKHKTWIHLLLFCLTVLSTFFVGLADGPIGALWYSAGIITILLTHEMGHYFMAKKYGISATLPYFIPFPFSLFGTMGAVIKMEKHVPNRRVLFDIGVAGPLAGIAIIIPAILIGIKLSRVAEISSLGEGSITLGNSLLFSFLARISIGSLPPGQDLILHPLAFAGWAGLLVTAINLLPVGQLDGGHILYALFWKRSKTISTIFHWIFLFICLFYFFGWFLLVLLLAIIRKHPPTLNDPLPLNRTRKIIGIMTLILFVLAFTPVPFGFGEGLIPMLLKQSSP